MPCFDKETDSTPKTAADAKALIGKRVKYLRARDIDRSGRGMFVPRYGTVTGNHGRDIVIDEDVIRPVELVVLTEPRITPGMRFKMKSVDGYLSSFGNVIRNRIGVVTAVPGHGRQVRATWAPKTSRGRVATGSVEIEDIEVITDTEATHAPVTPKPTKPAAPKLSWTKKKRARGDWHPAVGSQLTYAGKAVAHTQLRDGSWFWYGGYGDYSRNTHATPVATEAEAKFAAKTYVLSLIAPDAKPPRKPKVKDTEFYVQVMEDATQTVQDLRGPFPEHKAEKVCSGMSINLNHGRFSLRVVPKSKLKPAVLKDCGK